MRVIRTPATLDGCGSLSRRGCWNGEIEDTVPVAIQPLQFADTQEAIGALIPPHLHSSLDEAVKKGKDPVGVVRGGSVIKIDDWRVNVRSEDALCRGSLSEDVFGANFRAR